MAVPSNYGYENVSPWGGVTVVVTFLFFNLHGHFASRSQEMQIEEFKRCNLLKKNENSKTILLFKNDIPLLCI